MDHRTIASNFLFAMLCFATTAQAQLQFVAEDVDLLVGHRLVLKEKPHELRKYPLRRFVRHPEKAVPDLGEGIAYDLLILDTFLCTGVNDWKSQTRSNHRLIDLVTRSGVKLYYFVDTKYQHAFELEVIGGVTPPPKYYCKYVKKSVDRFDGTTIWRTEHTRPIHYIRRTLGDVSTYHLSLTSKAELPNAGDDVILLLNSGATMRKTCKMEVTVTDQAKFEASSYCALTPEEVDVLITDPIKAFRIYIYEADVAHPAKYSEMLGCMREAVQ